jgi:hypothetical protein
MKSFVPFTLALIAAVHAQGFIPEEYDHGIDTDPLYEAEPEALEDAEVDYVSPMDTTTTVDPEFVQYITEQDHDTVEVDNTTEADIVSETVYEVTDHVYSEEYELAFDLYIVEQTHHYDEWVQKQVSNWSFDKIIDTAYEEMWGKATAQWGFMPDVCPDGEDCRTEIWTQVEIDVKSEFSRVYENLIRDLNSLMIQCGLEFEAAWRQASLCPHGCTYTCSEQKVIYTNTINRMSALERQIYELEIEYETEVNTFHEIRSDCPDEADM